MLSTIKTRRSVREWKADDVLDKDIDDILEAAMSAPSAGNERCQEFLVLRGKDAEDFEAISQNAPKGAPVGILVCGNLDRQKYEGFYVQDCCASIENILLAIHAKGLGGVWTAVFPSNVDAVRKRFGLPARVVPVGYVPFGKPAKNEAARESIVDRERIHRGSW